ncbi:MAG TPA: hypothetical protein VFS00_18425 [Polyangiaceae bacterium]|nr:hypothetical protein [Polyangiaceae bacterium]
MRSPSARKGAPGAAIALWGAAVACAWAGAGACHRALDLDEPQCRADGDCVGRGFAEGAARCVDEYCRPDESPWSCLGRVQLPPARGAPVPFTLRVLDASANTPLPGATTRLCGRIDPECGEPLSAPTAADADGYATFAVLDTFDGYVEVEDPGFVKSLYYPQLSFFRRGGGRGPYVAIATPATLGGLAAANGVALDPAFGNVLLYVVDCRGRPAAGVRLEADAAGPNTSRYYLVNRVPDRNATATDGQLGGGGFINASVGQNIFSAFVAETGQPIARASLAVRPGLVTYAVLEPAP